MKWLRWIGIGIGALVLTLAIAGFTLYAVGGSKMSRKIDVDVYPIAIPSDSVSIAEGTRLAQMYGCTDCHGEHLEGTVMIEDPMLGRVVAPHIAPGRGSVTAEFTDEDWLRAVRHGVGRDGRPLVIMPASIYQELVSGEDIGKILAYVQRVDAIDNEPPETRLRLAQVMLGAGIFPFEYDLIEDHAAPPPARPRPDQIVELGSYVGATCRACHGEDLMGADEAGFPAPQLARGGGVIDAWTEEDFGRFFDTGVTPDGREIDPNRMPWKNLGLMTESEKHAVWSYLQTVAAPTQ